MAAAASSFSLARVRSPALPFDEAAAVCGGDGEVREEGCGVCAICLDSIALQETALVQGCDHAYCVTCILRWASYKQAPVCPQCKHPFQFLSVHRSLDGCIHDYLFEESVCLLLRAPWYEPLIVEPQEKALDEDEYYHSFQYEDIDEDDLYEQAYHISRSPSIRIGNRRWGDNGYVRGGRREAMPVSTQTDPAPFRTPIHKEALPTSQSDPASSSMPKNKQVQASVSGSGSGSGSVVSKDVAGRRARRAQKREAADRAAAEKHLKHLQRLGLGIAPEAPPKAPAAELGPQTME